MKAFLFLITILHLNFLTLFSQVEFVGSVTSPVEVGEQFRLVYSCNSQVSEFKAPDLKNFDYYGPSQSSSQSTSIINGRISSKSEYTFTYILSAKKEGKFNIGSAVVKVDGKTYNSNAITIEVGKSNSQTANNQNNSNVKADGNKDLFVSVNLDKNSAFQGECIVATIVVYTKLNLVGFDPNEMKFPKFDGFWSQELETSGNISLQRQTVGGTVYNAGTMKKYLLFPQRSGDINIESATVGCIVRVNTGQNSFFWGPVTQDVKKVAVSSPKKVTIKALPGTKPEDFYGAVGNFQFSADIDKTKLKANEAITLKIKISGTGNIKLIDPMKIQFPPDFETYDPKISENIKNTSSNSTGTKNIEYLIIPRHAGSFKIPPITFSYFDLNSKSYKTLSSKEFLIEVEKGNQENNTVVTDSRKEDVKSLGTDIRFIKTKSSDFENSGNFLLGSWKFYGSIGAMLGLFFVLFVMKRQEIIDNANISKFKNRKALSISIKRLKTAEKLMKQQKNNEFYNEVLRALWGYLSDKLGIPVSELSKDNITAVLEKKNVDKESIEQLMKVLNDCEFARYAPAGIAGSLSDIYAEASKLIQNMENVIK